MNFDSKIWCEEMLFLWNQSINIIYPNEGVQFMVPDHEKNGDYYENPHLSHCWTCFTSKENGRKRSFSFETKPLMSFIPMSGTSLQCPILKKKEIISRIHVFPNWWINFDSEENMERKAFLIKPKHQHYLSQ